MRRAAIPVSASWEKAGESVRRGQVRLASNSSAYRPRSDELPPQSLDEFRAPSHLTDDPRKQNPTQHQQTRAKCPRSVLHRSCGLGLTLGRADQVDIIPGE
jgi:hypothetical protein